MKIEAQISIIASYDNKIYIKIHDKTSGMAFVELELNNEQFVNAAMNRLGNTEVMSAEVHSLERVGKTHEHKSFEFEIPKWHDKTFAKEYAKNNVPNGWIPDLEFNSQTSFYEKDGKSYARTTIRRWV